MEDKNELIVVKQLPIIEEHLKQLSKEIDEKVANAVSLVVSDETIKDVKKTRSELKKDFDELELQRKSVKEAVMKPYNDFENLYKEYVSNKFKQADSTLKTKIEDVETAQKKEKESKIRRYFEELCQKESISFVRFEQMGLNITLSVTEKNLKEQVELFVQNIVDDLKTIESMKNADEILVEYMKRLDLNQSIREVTERYRLLEEQKQKKEQVEEQKLTDETMLNKIESLSAPKVEKEEIFELNFKVRGTKDKLKLLKQFLDNGGYDYE